MTSNLNLHLKVKTPYRKDCDKYRYLGINRILLTYLEILLSINYYIYLYQLTLASNFYTQHETYNRIFYKVSTLCIYF